MPNSYAGSFAVNLTGTTATKARDCENARAGRSNTGVVWISASRLAESFSPPRAPGMRERTYSIPKALPLCEEPISASLSPLTDLCRSATLKAMKEKEMDIRLIEFMDGRPDGWGHEQGRQVYERLRAVVEAHPAKEIIRISLAGVKRTDITFPRES